MKKYNTLVAGGGPCGIFSALELSDEQDVVIVDAGRALEEKHCAMEDENDCTFCKPVCHILGGFGGAQFFQGTKLSRYPAGSGLLNFCEDEDELESLYDYVDGVLAQFGNTQRQYPAVEKIDFLRDQFAQRGIELKYYNSQKVANHKMNQIARNMRAQLEQSGVDINLQERVVSIDQDGNSLIITTTRDTYCVENVVLAVGRLGSRQLIKMADKTGIQYSQNDQQLEIGVRVEGHHSIFNPVDDVCNDIKLKRKLNGGSEELRSFCQDFRGFITRCVYNYPGDKVVSSLDGHIMGTAEHGGRMSEVVNLAVHHRFPYQGDLKDRYRLVSGMSMKDRPIVETMSSFLGNNGSTVAFANRLSLPYARPASIGDYLPESSLTPIRDFVMRIDKVLPGFADPGNAVYAPSFELGWEKMKLDQSLQTNIRGIYIGGDVTGHFRGALQAMVSGVLIARNILKKR